MVAKRQSQSCILLANKHKKFSLTRRHIGPHVPAKKKKKKKKKKSFSVQQIENKIRDSKQSRAVASNKVSIYMI